MKKWLKTILIAIGVLELTVITVVGVYTINLLTHLFDKRILGLYPILFVIVFRLGEKLEKANKED